MDEEFWDELLSTLPTELQPGEVTVGMLLEKAQVLDHKSMKRRVDQWIKEGKVVYVGKRLIHGRSTDAYRMAKPLENIE